ncbi:MAG: acyltransferase [Candidatus Competibacteraceae bacterium]
MYFDNINLLRAFAALSVLVYHVIELYPWKSFPVEGPLLWFRIGWLGVDLFFVISGFVITLTASQLFEQHGNQFYKTFFRRRIARILPLYLLTGFLFILFCEPAILKSPALGLYKNLIYHLLFIHNLDLGTHGAIDGPNWSVGIEMQFYLLIMISIKFLIRIHPALILFGCILISWIWRTLVFFVLCQEPACDAFHKFFLSTQLIGCLDEFGFGICLCRLVLNKDRFFPPTSIFRSAWFWMFGTTLIAWLTFALFWKWANYWNLWWMVILWRTLAGMTFFMVLGTAIWLVSLIKFNRYFFGPLWYLGEISYGIYLWHILVIRNLNQANLFSAPELLFWTLFFTIALSAFSWHFVEKPLIKRFR